MAGIAATIKKLVFGNAELFRRYMNLYRPFLGAGIRVARITQDFREVDVELRRQPGNGNAFGTHFGGSLYAMTDPIYVLMFVGILGDGYLIWDKSAKIEFIKPGRGTVTAKFRLSDADIEAARAATASGAKYLPVFVVDVVDQAGVIVARVEKELYIRRKPQRGGRDAA